MTKPLTLTESFLNTLQQGKREMTTPMETYTETVHRFRIMRHEDRLTSPEDHKSRMRIMGIDPHDNWQLIASFINKRDANRELKLLREESAWFQTYKLVDADCGEQYDTFWKFSEN